MGKRGPKPYTNADALPAVRKSQAAFESAKRTFHEEVFRAHNLGNSNRTLATNLGVSRETVRQIVASMRTWAEKEQAYLDAPYMGQTMEERERFQREHTRRQKRLDYVMGR